MAIRGSPAKGVDGLNRARVRIPLGAPFINAGDESIFVYIREKTSVQIGSDVFFIYLPGSSEFRGNNNLLSGIRRIH